MQKYFYPVIKEIKTYVSGFRVAEIAPEKCVRIILFNAGSCVYSCGSFKERCYAGNILLIGENTGYRVKNKSDDFSCSSLDVTVAEGKCKGVDFTQSSEDFFRIKSFLQRNSDVVIFSDDGGTHADFIRLLSIYLANAKFDRSVPIVLLLVSILKNIDMQLQSIYNDPKSYSPYVNKAIRYIKSNYSNQISAQDVADFIGVHVNYLHKLFSEEVGKTMLNYIQELRIAHAKELLRKSSRNIDEIAEACSIGNIKYFYRMFKKSTGLTPREFRNTYDLTSNYEDEDKYEIEKVGSEELIKIRGGEKFE